MADIQCRRNMAVWQKLSEFEPGCGGRKIANAERIKKARYCTNGGAFRRGGELPRGKGRFQHEANQTNGENGQQAKQNSQNHQHTPSSAAGWLTLLLCLTSNRRDFRPGSARADRHQVAKLTPERRRIALRAKAEA